MRAVWLVVCLLGLAMPAHAQTDAKALLDEANTHFRDGEFREAADGFQELKDHLGEDGWFLHYNLGLAFENLGVPTKAAKHYDAFVGLAEQRAPDDEKMKERVEDAKARLAKIEERFGPLEAAPPPPAPVPPPAPPPPSPAPVPPPDAPDEHSASDEQSAFPTLTVVTLSALAVASIALPIGLSFHTNGLRDEAAALGTAHPDYPAARDDFNSTRMGYYASFALPAVLGVAAFTVVIVHVASDDESATVHTDGRGVWLSGRF